MEPATLDRENASGQLINEVPVVGDKDHRSPERQQRFEQHILSAQVEVIGGFIEEQEILWTDQHACERIPVALTAGKHADAFEDLVIRK